MKNKLAILGALVVLAQGALAGNIGIGYGVTTPIYHNDKNDYVLPIVDLEYEKFFLKGGGTYGLSWDIKLSKKITMCYLFMECHLVDMK